MLGWWALAVVVTLAIGFTSVAAGSGGERCFTLPAQCIAVPRLRRSHPCRGGLCLRGRSGSARVGRSLSFAAGRPASSPGVSKTPLRRYHRAASGPGGCRLATIPTFGQRSATFSGAFRPCRFSRLRRLAPLRASQAPRRRGPGSARAESAPEGVSPATDRGVHAVSAPAAVRALSRSVPVPLGARTARIGRERAACQARPRSCPTLRSVSLGSSRPVVTDGRCPLAGSGRCGWPKAQLRTVVFGSAGVCRPQGLAPLPSPLPRRLSPTASARCSPGLDPGAGGGRGFRGHRAGKPHGGPR
jgi:hypothetical protein